MPPEIPNLLQKRPDENKRDSSTETDTTTSSESDQEEETVNKGKKNLTWTLRGREAKQARDSQPARYEHGS